MKKPPDLVSIAGSTDVSAHQTPKQGSPERSPYEKPQVIDHGRLADFALGGATGVGDSGSENTQQP